MLKKIESLEGVNAVHDFHCWSLSRGKYSMSCHIECENDSKIILEKAIKIVKNYKIEHSTIQMEENMDCAKKETGSPKKEHDHGHDHGDTPHGHDSHGHEH